MTRAVEAWERFWFRDVETSTLALFRIAFGVVVVAWTISLAPALYSFFGDDGILPAHPDGGSGAWGLLQLDSSAAAVTLLYLLLLVGGLCLLVGFRTRLAAVVVFVCLVSFARRDPWVLNSGDLLIFVLAFYLMLAPSGAALSVDRWLGARRRFWEFPRRSIWPLQADPGPGEPALLLRGLGEGPRRRRGTTGRRCRTRSGSRISSGSRSPASSPTRSSS